MSGKPPAKAPGSFKSFSWLNTIATFNLPLRISIKNHFSGIDSRKITLVVLRLAKRGTISNFDYFGGPESFEVGVSPN